MILLSCALTPVLLAPTRARAGGVPLFRLRVERLTRKIPDSFLGLSMEMNEFRRYADEGPVLARVVSLIRSGKEPVNLRLGGRSADETLWGKGAKRRPGWIFAIGPQWLPRLNHVAEQDDLRVTLDLNLWAGSPSMAARFAHAALQAMGPSRLAGVAIGNEPDLYRSPNLIGREQVVEHLAHGRLSKLSGRYSPARYRRSYLAYGRALAAAAHGLPLLGPEMTRPDLKWFHPLTALHRFRPQFLTVHRYPLSNCWPKTTFEYPRVSSLLSDRASAGFAGGLRGVIALARRAGLRLWVSEINSASCGGRRGVTNAFASALWAPDALLALVRAGVAGVNWHLRPGKLNAPFLLRGKRIEPLPELYGLALFARLVGTGGRLAAVSSSPGGSQTFRVWAVRSSQGLGVLLINKGADAVRTQLLGAADGTQAAVERLTAPSIRSRRGVRLSGQWIGPDGEWHGSPVVETVTAESGYYEVAIPAYSAALVQIRPQSGNPPQPPAGS